MSSTEINTAKAALVEAISQTSRGRQTTPEQSAVVSRLIENLELLNPTTVPTGAAHLLSGNWKMLYTTSEGLIRLGTSLPGLTTGEIYQFIQADTQQVINVAEVQGSGILETILPKSIFSVKATFTIASDQRVFVTFRDYVLGLQAVMNYEIDTYLTLLQHKPEQLPALKIPIAEGQQAGWLDITYLDSSLRIGRGNAGSIFVLERVESSALSFSEAS